MKVLISKNSGFCFGVNRAIELASCLIQSSKKNIYSLGEIIHNKQVVEKLKSSGLKPIQDISQITKGHILIRSHGISLSLLEEIKKRKLKIIDATCPFIKKIQKIVQKLDKEGYLVIIIGEKNHPEIKSLISFAKEVIVVKNKQEALKVKKFSKIGIVGQTTIPQELFYEIVNILLKNKQEVRVYNTICNTTIIRQKNTISLAKKVNLMLIVGNKNSANTFSLYKLCKKINKNTYHIEEVNEIKNKWLSCAKSVGISGGASTPNWVIKKIAEKCKLPNSKYEIRNPNE
ncbi:MAG: 4-hydroxy-3-methylbut-2-enyl diphosphate reductase [bacterium]